MRALIAWFVKNPVAANLLMVVMFLVGIFGYTNLEREFIPQTTFNGVTIDMSWPGANPRDAAEQLVTRAEEAIEALEQAIALDPSGSLPQTEVARATLTQMQRLLDGN